mmetsp:Transcript_12091/g.17731  ORF Transcript_12091/g.17731 Transcript_12091/m.17731 type:complete len:201 (-) Transcript_12091:1418-2020(-)
MVGCELLTVESYVESIPVFVVLESTGNLDLVYCRILNAIVLLPAFTFGKGEQLVFVFEFPTTVAGPQSLTKTLWFRNQTSGVEKDRGSHLDQPHIARLLQVSCRMKENHLSDRLHRESAEVGNLGNVKGANTFDTQSSLAHSVNDSRPYTLRDMSRLQVEDNAKSIGATGYPTNDGKRFSQGRRPRGERKRWRVGRWVGC